MSAIPYDEIDVEIRKLVWLMNEFPGIATTFSCIGHQEDAWAGYVSFTARSQEDLERLIQALPFLSWQGGLVANRFFWKVVSLEVYLDSDRAMNYRLAFSANAQDVQRRLVGEIEAGFAAALSRHSTAHPLGSNGVSVPAADTP